MTAASSPSPRLRLRWFGQSSFALQAADGTSLFVDPYFPTWRNEADFIHPEPPIDEETCPVDAVFVTHDHLDHNFPESIRRLLVANRETLLVGPAEATERWHRSWIPPERACRVTVGDEGRVGSVGYRVVLAKPPEGDPARGVAPPDVEHLGFVFDFDGLRVWVTGDPINHFADRKDLVAPVAELRPDIAVITTHPDEGEFPFFEGAWAMAERVGSRVVIPAHYHCFRRRTYDPAAFAALAPAGFECRIPAYGGEEVFA